MSLNNIYKSLGPKFGKYGKHILPLSFSKYNTRDVVINTREKNNATVFDVSHMCIYECLNTETIRYELESMLKFKLSKLKKNKSKLSAIVDRNNYIIDDLIISNIDDSKYRLVVNSNSKEYFIKYNFLKEIEKNILAIQGDGSQKIIENIINVPLNNISFLENINIDDDRIEISRCGYTGEDGFELYMDNKTAGYIFQKLIDKSNINNNIHFGGLSSRDILRLEAGLNLSGAEFSQDMGIPFDAINMNFLIDKNYRPIKKSNYKQVKLYSDKPIRKGNIFSRNNMNIGFITSSNISYNLNKFIALGYIDTSKINNKDELYIVHKYKKNNIKIEPNNFINTNYYKR
tara:strand:- start:2892 stop:3926 length:1035 start_codon:yes stop_codon:yes gene_type:complete